MSSAWPLLDTVRHGSVSKYRYLHKKNFAFELPDELWLHVLSYLSPFDLARSTQLSKRFRQLASDDVLWRPLCLLEDAFCSDQATVGASWKQLYLRIAPRPHAPIDDIVTEISECFQEDVGPEYDFEKRGGWDASIDMRGNFVVTCDLDGVNVWDVARVPHLCFHMPGAVMYIKFVSDTRLLMDACLYAFDPRFGRIRPKPLFILSAGPGIRPAVAGSKVLLTCNRRAFMLADMLTGRTECRVTLPYESTHAALVKVCDYVPLGGSVASSSSSARSAFASSSAAGDGGHSATSSSSSSSSSPSSTKDWSSFGVEFFSDDADLIVPFASKRRTIYKHWHYVAWIVLSEQGRFSVRQFAVYKSAFVPVHTFFFDWDGPVADMAYFASYTRNPRAGQDTNSYAVVIAVSVGAEASLLFFNHTGRLRVLHIVQPDDTNCEDIGLYAHRNTLVIGSSSGFFVLLYNLTTDTLSYSIENAAPTGHCVCNDLCIIDGAFNVYAPPSALRALGVAEESPRFQSPRALLSPGSGRRRTGEFGT